MGLELSTQSVGRTKSQALLDAYLNGACFIMSGLTKRQASKEAKKLLNDDNEAAKLLGQVEYGDVLKKEVELNAEAEAAPFKIKANYFLNAEKEGSALTYAASGVATAVGAAMIQKSTLYNGFENLTLSFNLLVGGGMIGAAGISTAIGITAYYCAGKMTRAGTAEEKAAVDRYADVKHAQLALKQLKKAIEKDRKQAVKSPDGLTAAALQKKAFGR